jgi:signal transduction histidine kinase
LKTLTSLLVSAICLYACNKPHNVGSAAASPDIKKAEAYLDQQNDSAYYYFNKVISHPKDSLEIAMAYVGMGVMQSNAGDYFGGQETLLMSLRYLDERNDSDLYCLSSVYNELGNTNVSLKNYPSAIEYYDLAIRYAQEDDYKQVFLNNKAVAYEKMHAFAQAVAIYDTIIIKSKNDSTEYARVLSNRAHTRWQQDPDYDATPELLTALFIRIKQKDYWGQNASFAHLADYYTHTHPDSALFYANKMYATAQYLNSPDDEVEALQKLIALTSPQHIKQYFARYQYLNDSLQTARSTARNQFALIRYNVEKNKLENLKLQKENADKKLQIILQLIIIGGVLAALIFLMFWYKKRKQQMALKAENTIREHKLKTSAKVHDVVANGLYRLITQIDHASAIDKESLVHDLDVMYEQSRDISYEHPIANDYQDYDKQISSLLSSFDSLATRVLIAGNNKKLWEQVNSRVKKEVKFILEELMINMKKHSQASAVAVKFEQQDDRIRIQYTDNGIGLPPKFSFGNGLTSTGNRIHKIDGDITFTNTETGLKIQFSFPIA